MFDTKLNFSQLVHFTIKQVEATKIADKHKYTLFGGSAGPGKSYWLRWYPVRQLIRWHKKTGLTGIRAGLFSEDFPSLKDRQISKMAQEFPDWLGEIKESKTDGFAFHLRRDFGSSILALRNLDDPSKYKSSEFALIAVEELTRNNKEVFDTLRHRLRWTGIEKPQFVAATNPGEKGHVWVKKIWIDQEFESQEIEKHEFAYVKALPTDNPYLAESYLNQLKSLPEKQRKALLEGNWDVFEGQYFSQWNRDKHVCEPFTIPADWKRFRTYDYGFENPACCLWFALDYDGRVWVYRELYFPKGHKTDGERQALEINRLSEGEKYEYSIADPAIFASTGMVDKQGGQTIAETFARNGIVFFPGSNRRIDGWGLMHRYLRWDDQNKPKLIYFSTCKNSIRTLPMMIHDERKPEDLDSALEDHAADCIRYGLMSLHERKTPAPLSKVEQKLEEFKRQSKSISPSQLNKLYYGEN